MFAPFVSSPDSSAQLKRMEVEREQSHQCTLTLTGASDGSCLPLIKPLLLCGRSILFITSPSSQCQFLLVKGWLVFTQKNMNSKKINKELAIALTLLLLLDKR